MRRRRSRRKRGDVKRRGGNRGRRGELSVEATAE
jgi:hypothetical protein